MRTPTIKDAIRVACKSLPLVSVKQRNARLEFAADDMADAYQIGAEEAQATIIARLMTLAKQEVPDGS